MRLWCALFGHRFNPPVRNSRGHKSHMTCRRCSIFLLPDYYDGWRPASKREREFRLRAIEARDSASVAAPAPDEMAADL